jgi:hypothetical protein
MPAFGGKADMTYRSAECLLLTDAVEKGLVMIDTA